MNFEAENVRRCQESRPLRAFEDVGPRTDAKPIPQAASPQASAYLADAKRRELVRHNVARLKYQAVHGVERPIPRPEPPRMPAPQPLKVPARMFSRLN